MTISSDTGARGRVANPSPVMSLDPRRVAVVLGLTAVGLTLMSVLTQVLHHADVTWFRDAETLTRLWNVDNERSIPTWYSVILLGAAAGLLAGTGRILRSVGESAREWGALALLFVALSADELTGVHERTGPLLRRAFDVSVYAWVIPAALVGLALLPWLLRFLSRLPAPTRRYFMVAGMLFVFGALGIEGLSGIYAEMQGEDNLAYELISSLEEAFEMMGVVVFVAALLDHLRHLGAIEFRLSPLQPLEAGGRADGTG